MAMCINESVVVPFEYDTMLTHIHLSLQTVDLSGCITYTAEQKLSTTTTTTTLWPHHNVLRSTNALH